MSKLGRIVTWTVLGVVVLAALVFLFWPREPSYQGRTLSAWLGELRWAGGPQQEQAIAAIRQIGTNAVPTLVNILGSRHTSFKQRLVTWLNRQKILGIQFKVPPDLHWQTTLAFRTLGPLAQSAIPELTELLRHGINPGYVTTSLAAIGPASLPSLVEGINHHDRSIQVASAVAIGSLGTNAEPVLPVLLNALRSHEKQVRQIIAPALSTIDQRHNQAIPMLIQNLEDPDAEVRRISIVALASYGSRATAAVPALLRCKQDPDVLVAREAIMALIKVDPQTAAKAGYYNSDVINPVK